jgi:hypothetical protein
METQLYIFVQYVSQQEVMYLYVCHKALVVVGHIEADTKIASDTSTELHGLQKHSNYSIQVWAYTHVGDGVKSNPIFCITDEAGKISLDGSCSYSHVLFI